MSEQCERAISWTTTWYRCTNVRMILAVGTQVEIPGLPTDRRSKQDISSLARYKADDVRGFAFEIQGRITGTLY